MKAKETPTGDEPDDSRFGGLSSKDWDEAVELLAEVNDLVQAESAANQRLQMAVSTAKADLVAAQLAETSIDSFAKRENAKGVRWGAIKGAGYATVKDLRNVSASRLEQIQGVGPSTSTTVANAIRRHVQEVERSVVLRIDPHTPTKQTLLIIEATAEVDRVRQAILPVRQELPGALASLSRLVPAVRRADSWWWRFFILPFQRQKYRDDVAELDSVVSGLVSSGTATGIQQARSKLKQRTERAADDVDEYLERAAHFNALLAEVTGEGVDTQAEAGGLPGEVREKISGQELNLSLLTGVTLRRYQAFGAKFALRQQKVLLGDEMGLGKTVEALACMAHLAAEGKGHYLVICPASVLINWDNEIRRFTDFEPFRLHGQNKFGQTSVWTEDGGVAITTYGTLTALPNWDRWAPRLLVVDEAHLVKNPQAQRSKAVRTLTGNSDRVIYMTGTPLENRVEEFEQLIRNLRPDIASQAAKTRSAAAFRMSVAPVYLRRTQKQVLKELPDRIVVDDWLAPTAQDELFYLDAVRRRHIPDMRRATLTGFSPRQSSKLRRLDEIVNEALQNGRKVIAYSYFLDVLRSMQEVLGNRGFARIDGSVAPSARQRIIDEFTAASEPGVLISQIEAGGLGLNIQAASVVVIAEPQWKPSAENQAIARSHRMGQTSSVLVHRLLTLGTADRWINCVLREKERLVASFTPSETARREPDALDPKDIEMVRQARNQRELEQLIVDREYERLVAAGLISPG